MHCKTSLLFQLPNPFLQESPLWEKLETDRTFTESPSAKNRITFRLRQFPPQIFQSFSSAGGYGVAFRNDLPHLPD
jgi:hypothetical protein